jgi:hypothetical protein
MRGGHRNGDFFVDPVDKGRLRSSPTILLSLSWLSRSREVIVVAGGNGREGH